MGQEWKYDQTNTTLSFVSDYSIPAANGGNASHFGHAVEVYNSNGNGGWQVNFAGDVYSANGTNPFFGFRQTSDINSTLQYCNDFISKTPTTNNRALDFCINNSTGEVLYGGYMNESGDHPIGYNNIYPVTPFSPPSWDFYLDKLYPVLNSGLIDNWHTFSTTHDCEFEYYTDEFAMCSDNEGKYYFTGSWTGKLGVDDPASLLNTTGTASLNCYVARLFDLETGSAIKSIATQQAQINKKQLILIYPNPTKGLVFFQSPVPNDCLNKFELTTVNGQSLNESVNFVTQDGQNGIDLSNLKKGMYYLKTYWDSGTQLNKVVLQ